MIFITGAGGFIGKALHAHLQAQGHKIIPVYRSREFRIENDRIILDLTDRDHIEFLKKSEIVPDLIVHLAGHIEISLKKGTAKTGYRPVCGDEDISGIYNSNLTATIHLIDYCLCAGVRHLVFASSQAVYGMPSSENVTEESPSQPLEHYAMSKFCCEKILELASGEEFSVNILRFPGIYSEKKASGAVYGFCKSALDRGEIRVNSEIPLPFDTLYLDDLLNAFKCVVDIRPEGYSIFNISTGEPNSLNLLADRIAGLVPGCTVHHAEISQPVIRLDPTKAYRDFGWRSLPSETRLRHMLDVMTRD